jgi:hypothetical protein
MESRRKCPQSRQKTRPVHPGAEEDRPRHDPQTATTGGCGVTIDQLRAAISRTLRFYGAPVSRDVLDELVAIADHHAAEETAAAATEKETA